MKRKRKRKCSKRRRIKKKTKVQVEMVLERRVQIEMGEKQNIFIIIIIIMCILWCTSEFAGRFIGMESGNNWLAATPPPIPSRRLTSQPIQSYSTPCNPPLTPPLRSLSIHLTIVWKRFRSNRSFQD